MLFSGNLRGATQMIRSIKSFVANESGATAIEYALIASLMAVALVTVLTSLGTRLSSEFSEVSGVLK
jgi:pilus assembly protein Flp/PilA